ncbi:hypothetical protein BgiBS90_016367, partial [Biomphalaria glabrata]
IFIQSSPRASCRHKVSMLAITQTSVCSLCSLKEEKGQEKNTVHPDRVPGHDQ